MGGMVVPGARQSGSGTQQMPTQTPQALPPEYIAQLNEQNRIKKLVNAYKANPAVYSETEALQIQRQALEAGIPMEINSSAGAKWTKGLLSMVDSATLGIVIPNTLYTPVNAEEQRAVDIGHIAGFVNPFGMPFKLAGAGKAALGATKMGKSFFKGGAGKAFKEGFKNPFGFKANPFSKAKPKTPGTKTPTTPKAPTSGAPRVDRGNNFGQSVNNIIKKAGDKTTKGSFWKAVLSQKTPEARVKAAMGWMKKNMHPDDLKIGNIEKRLEGFFKGKMGVGAAKKKAATKVAPKKVAKPTAKARVPRKAKKTSKQIIKEAKEKTAVKKHKLTSLKKRTKALSKTEKKKTITSSKTKHTKGNKGKKVIAKARLKASERAKITAEMKKGRGGAYKRAQKFPKGQSRDRYMIRWAESKGLLT